MKTQPEQLTVPSAGSIKGGRLNGWHFHILHFRAEPRGLKVVARCTPPAWPFPWDIALTHEHFGSLKWVVKGGAKRIPALPQIIDAYRVARLQLPEWMKSKPMTLRAIVKRAHTTTARPLQ